MESNDAARREVIRQILELEQQKTPLAEDAARSTLKELYRNACRCFGSWQVALDYAGVPARRGARQICAPESVVRRIRRRCASLYSVRAKYVRKTDNKLYCEALATFGSWNGALEAADIRRDRLMFGPENPKLNVEQILELLRSRAASGESLRLVDFACENQALTRSIVYRFKCWQNALVEAGLGQDVKDDGTKEEDDKSRVGEDHGKAG